MKALVLSLFLVFTLTASAQNFRKDWNFFKLRTGWYLNFSKDKSPYVGTKKTQGHMTFTSSKDSTLRVVYYIYLKMDMDTAFVNKINQSRLLYPFCMNKDDKIDLNFESFEYKDFFYLTKPCPDCPMKNKDCAILAQDIFDFVSGK